MPDESNELGDALTSFVKHMVRGHVVYEGTVDSVDETNFVCDCDIDGVTFYAVPLKVLTGSQASVIELPVVGSNVLLTFRDGNIQRPQIIFIDNVDKLLVNCQTSVIFNGGNLGGMVKVIPLNEDLNALQNDVNTLKKVFQTWTPVADDGGAALKAAAASWAGQELTVTEQSSIEDKSILH
jgi:hypothetical protein